MRKLSTQETYGVVIAGTKNRIGVPYDKQLGLHILPGAMYHFTATGRIGYQLEYFDDRIFSQCNLPNANVNRHDVRIFGERLRINRSSTE